MNAMARKLDVIRLTDAAAERIREQIARSETPIAGLRVGVKNGGCAGMSYTMDYATEIKPFDEVVEVNGVKLIIDAKAVLFLLGTTLDIKADKFSSGFVFLNPNETSACGCGESVAIEPAKPDALAASRA
ncbi:MAG: iron-sulfur cluster assembly accessory protein [Proteobacteria bacterium]|nr:iron-sulfur cluster assembly accessory protein [Pseudomonadota bacterium]